MLSAATQTNDPSAGELLGSRTWLDMGMGRHPALLLTNNLVHLAIIDLDQSAMASIGLHCLLISGGQLQCGNQFRLHRLIAI